MRTRMVSFLLQHVLRSDNPLPATSSGMASVLLLSMCAMSQAQDWPSIRGPQYDGSAIIADSSVLAGPLTLDVAWKRAIGSGYSGIVSSGTTLVTAAADAEAGKEFVMAIDAVTGQTRWRAETGPIFRGENGSFDGPIATPAVDPTQAYHLSPHGLLAAYSLQDGRRIWSRQLRDELGSTPNFYGFGASPIVHRGKVILPVGSPDGAIMAFDSATGATLWGAGEDSAGFQTCIVTNRGDDELLIAAGNSKTFGIDPSDGKVRWMRPHEAASPMGSWAAIPVPLSAESLFLLDGDSRSSGIAFSGDEATTQWNGREIRNTYCVPVVVNGILCTYSSRFLIGLDPTTGERLFRQRNPGNGFVTRLGDRLVIATLAGSLHIGDVTDEGFEEVIATDVFDTGADGPDGQMWALPSMSGDAIYLRSLGAIARVDFQAASQRQAIAARPSRAGGPFSQMLSESAQSTTPQTIVDRYVSDRTMPVVEDGHIHFMLRGDHDDVAVGSDLFGLRQERSMIRIEGTDWFYYATPVPNATRVSYAYFADYQPTADPSNPNRYRSSIIDRSMEPLFMGPAESLSMAWLDLGVPQGPPELESRTLAGKLTRATIDSQVMGKPIAYTVYTPPDYADEGDDELPVCFVHDGGVAMTVGRQAAIVDSLIETGRIPPAILVFIEWRFYPMMGADGYPQMFGGELIPAVESKFRLSDDREQRASLGGGFGATLALMSSLANRASIGRIGCHSPFAFELLHPAIEQLAMIPGPASRVRINYGELEVRNPSENWDMANQAIAIDRILSEAGHDVDRSQSAIGTDWVCWRTQSEAMYDFLIGD
ncbi:MAG: PQQ-binding-like beta-propeller repeat protein [Planctomycetota bacterium]